MRDGLPPGWAQTVLGELGCYENGRGFKKEEWGQKGRPIIRIQNLTGTSRAFNFFEGPVDERHVARPGDLLMSWAATLDAFRWQGPEALVNQHIFKVTSYIDPTFHFYLLKAALPRLAEDAHGSGMVHVTRGKFEQQAVSIPPLAEQRRIASILDEALDLQARITNGVIGAMRRAQAFEMAVCTSVWDQAAAAGPLTAVTDIATVTGGIQKSPARRAVVGQMVNYLRVANVLRMRLDLAEVHQIPVAANERERALVRPGDLLVVEGNGSIDQLGRGAIWRGQPGDWACQNHLIRVRPSENMSADFLELLWASSQAREQIKALASSTSGLHTLTTKKVGSICIPVPPLDVQGRLSLATRAALESRAAIQRRAEMLRRRVEALQSSLLRAAVEGRLVPQDPADEPAELLLERIAAGREAEAATPGPARTVRRRAAAAAQTDRGAPA